MKYIVFLDVDYSPPLMVATVEVEAEDEFEAGVTAILVAAKFHPDARIDVLGTEQGWM